MFSYGAHDHTGTLAAEPCPPDCGQVDRFATADRLPKCQEVDCAIRKWLNRTGLICYWAAITARHYGVSFGISVEILCEMLSRVMVLKNSALTIHNAATPTPMPIRVSISRKSG